MSGSERKKNCTRNACCKCFIYRQQQRYLYLCLAVYHEGYIARNSHSCNECTCKVTCSNSLDGKDASGTMETIGKTRWVVGMWLDWEPLHRGLDTWERLCCVRTQVLVCSVTKLIFPLSSSTPLTVAAMQNHASWVVMSRLPGGKHKGQDACFTLC